MSIRTVIEINHDHLTDANVEIGKLLLLLPGGSFRELAEEYQHSNAIRILGQRHHSETLKLEVK